MKSFLYRSSLCALPFLLFASMGIVAGGCPLTPPGETETTSDTTTTGDSSGMTTATLTSTTTVASTTATLTTSTTPTSTTSDPATTDPSDTSSETTDGPPCDKNLLCEGMEDASGCLHDCGTCNGDNTCDPTSETPYSCPSDCAETTCNGDAKVDALSEQCDDGNQADDDSCTNECKLNVCGDGHLYEAGDEECDDGNDDETDGCMSTCKLDRRLIFVSSGTLNGDMGGLAGADEYCAKLAPEGSGAFKAWLSDGNTGPSSRFGYSGAFVGLFVLADDKVVARGWNDLLGGDLEAAINRDESNQSVAAALVWTNTGTNGSPKGTAHCKGWSSSMVADKGHYGATELPDSTWTDIDLQSCAGTARVYCVQVAAP